MAIQKHRLKPRQQMNSIIQFSGILAKAKRHLLKQVVRLVFHATLFQA
jgi:hypothetical protein